MGRTEVRGRSTAGLTLERLGCCAGMLLCLFAEAPGCCIPGDGKFMEWNACSPRRLAVFVMLCSDAVCAALALGKCLCTHTALPAPLGVSSA